MPSIRVVATAGSPLPAEGYEYVYEQLGPDVLLINGSGGTDVCSAIVSGGPMLPVYRGEISGRCLGVDTAAFDDDGNEVVGELGELVIRQPMPSMPVRFWGDAGRRALPRSYFDVYPGVWRQGDWVRFTERGHLHHHRPLRRHAEPRRRAASGRASSTRSSRSCRRSSDSLVVHLEDPRAGQASSCCSSSPTSTTTCGRGSRARCAPSSRRATCRTRSPPSRRSRARSPARSSRRRSSGSCAARRPSPWPAADALAEPRGDRRVRGVHQGEGERMTVVQPALAPPRIVSTEAPTGAACCGRRMALEPYEAQPRRARTALGRGGAGPRVPGRAAAPTATGSS